MILLRISAALICLAIGSGLPAGATPPTGASAEAAAPLFHWNWCGAGDVNRATPVDALDEACQAHGLCYERVGRGACPCDRAILKATASLVRSSNILETIRSKAATVNPLFSAALCIESPKSPRQAGQR